MYEDTVRMFSTDQTGSTGRKKKFSMKNSGQGHNIMMIIIIII